MVRVRTDLHLVDEIREIYIACAPLRRAVRVAAPVRESVVVGDVVCV